MFSKEQGFFWRPLECLICRRKGPGLLRTEALQRAAGTGLLGSRPVPRSVRGFTCPRSGLAVAPDPPLSLSVKGEAGCHLSLMKGDKDSLPGALREIPRPPAVCLSLPLLYHSLVWSQPCYRASASGQACAGPRRGHCGPHTVLALEDLGTNSQLLAFLFPLACFLLGPFPFCTVVLLLLSILLPRFLPQRRRGGAPMEERVCTNWGHGWNF